MQSSVVVSAWLILSLASLSIGAVIRSDPTNVVIEVPLPRGYSRAQYSQSVIDYWTPERMASAIPLDITVDKMQPMPFFSNHQNPGVERILTPSAPLLGTRAAYPPAAGRVFFTMGGLNYVCSGSVVNSRNRDTVVSAGHCVYNNTGKFWATKWSFVPHYNSGERPLGTFVARNMATKQQWMDRGDYNNDVAILTMDVNENGKHAQDVAGAFGISLNANKKAQIDAHGFPMNINDGEILSSCSDVSTNPSLFLMPSFAGLQITCDMTGGASGGPWLQSYNPDTFSGQQVSLTSFGYALAPGKIHGPHFIEENIGSLFEENQDN